MTEQFISRVSLLIESELKEKVGKYKTNDTEIEGVKVATPEPMTHNLDPLVKVTEEDGA